MSVEAFIRDTLNIPGEVVNDWYRACCPIHGEKRPSFGINIHSLFYNCFSCGAKGTLLNLTKKLLGISEADAILLLEDKIERSLPTEEIWEKSAEVKEVSSLYVDVLSEALSKSNGLRYARYRGIPKIALDYYKIGFDAYKNVLKAPLTSVKTGSVLGFEERSFIGREVLKFTKVPAGYKNDVLLLPRDIKNVKTIILVEGLFDVLNLFKTTMFDTNFSDCLIAGLAGKVVSKSRISFVSQFDNVCLGFDRDNPGFAAEREWMGALSSIPLKRLLFDGDDPGESSEFSMETLI